eukprot:484933_1
MIKRHSEFRNLGMLLRECVECFGMRQPKMDIMKLYHGANRNFMFPSLSAFIKGPLSTTSDYLVATNFATPQGMILLLQLEVSDWTYDINFGRAQQIGQTFDSEKDYMHQIQICAFDCRVVSDFANEQEVFFCGGLYKFSIENII